MKILVIDNNPLFLKELVEKLGKKDEIIVITFEEVKFSDAKNVDAIILSGGQSQSIKNHPEIYQKESEIIKKSKVPVLGICLGFELICQTFGEKIDRLKVRKKGVIEIQKVGEDDILKGVAGKINVYENHRWVVREIKKLKILMKSECGIEMVKHPKKEIYGVQFHPESSKGKEGLRILMNFLKFAEGK